MRRECQERFPRPRFQRKPLVSDPGMHHGTCISHVPWCMSGSNPLWRGKRHPWRMRNPQFYVSGKRPIVPSGARTSPGGWPNSGPIRNRHLKQEGAFIVLARKRHSVDKSIHCGVVTPYGDIDRGQHWLRWWLVDDKKPLPEAMITSHQRRSVFTISQVVFMNLIRVWR